MTGFDPSSITWQNVIFSFSLIMLVLILTAFLKLNVYKSLMVGTIRAFLQLLLLGYILHYLLNIGHLWQLGLVYGAMIFIASYEGKRRQKIPIPGFYSLQVITLGGAVLIVLGTVLGLVLKLQPWFNPVVSIPIGGMVIGQALNASSVMSNNLAESFRQRQLEVETLLSLGANRRQASIDLIRDAVRTAMIPSINSMNTVGIVAIPGVMVGSLLGGVQPLVAIKYQILVMYLWTATTTLSCTILAFLVAGVFINRHHQLRRELFYKLRS